MSAIVKASRPLALCPRHSQASCVWLRKVVLRCYSDIKMTILSTAMLKPATCPLDMSGLSNCLHHLTRAAYSMLLLLINALLYCSFMCRIAVSGWQVQAAQYVQTAHSVQLLKPWTEMGMESSLKWRCIDCWCTTRYVVIAARYMITWPQCVHLRYTSGCG